MAKITDDSKKEIKIVDGFSVDDSALENLGSDDQYIKLQAELNNKTKVTPEKKKKQEKQKSLIKSFADENYPKWAAPLGALVLVLAIVGSISVGFLAYDVFRVKPLDPQRVSHYEELIAPVVLFDPDPFSTVSELDNTFLLIVSVYNNVITGSENNTIEYDNRGYMKIPFSMISSYSNKIFNTEELKAKTFSISGIQFVYNEENSCFLAPASGYLGYYIPKVTNIKTAGKTTTLTVQYFDVETTSQFEKEMIYVITEKQGKEYISSIKNSKNVSESSDLEDENIDDTSSQAVTSNVSSGTNGREDYKGY